MTCSGPTVLLTLLEIALGWSGDAPIGLVGIYRNDEVPADRPPGSVPW